MKIQKNRNENVEWMSEKWLDEWANLWEKFCFLNNPRSKYKIEKEKEKKK